LLRRRYADRPGKSTFRAADQIKFWHQVQLGNRIDAATAETVAKEE
jgi:hypothetical protein